jgi:hypothetical protein
MECALWAEIAVGMLRIGTNAPVMHSEASFLGRGSGA